MIPDPDAISVERAPETVLFPGEALDRIFYQGYDRHAPPLFGPMWEYPARREYRYVFMTRELLNLLWVLKQQGLVWGVQAEFGCSPWPATNIWFEDPANDALPEEAAYAVTETCWARKYAHAFEAIRASQGTPPGPNRGITRLLVDCHVMVHQLTRELPDHPVTAEMELRAFNNERDVLHDVSPDNPSAIGSIMGTDPKTLARLRRLNDVSFESARRRAAERQGASRGPGEPFIQGAVLSSLFNYIPWKAFLKKLDEHILPGGLLVVYNAREGERRHIDRKNLAADQETIAAFIQKDLGYALRIRDLIINGGPVTPLYLVAQKPTPKVENILPTEGTTEVRAKS